MSSNKAIVGLQKQNDSIYTSLVSKQIHFDRFVIPEEIDETEHLKLLSDENLKLKEIAKANKPPPPPPQQKPTQVPEPSQPQIKESIANKNKKEENQEDEQEEQTYDEPIKKFDSIVNMEDMKRAFFGGDYISFNEQLKLHPFKLYMVQYKYNGDKDGAPEFSAKNLLKGFVRNFDDYRKYFMICFRCWKAQDKNEYKYVSAWIVNTNEPVQNIIGSMWEDFEFEEFNDPDIFTDQMKKIPETDEPVFVDGFCCIGESYVH